MARNRVDLPVPLTPSMATNSPGAMSRSRRSSTRRPSNARVSPRTRAVAEALPAEPWRGRPAVRWSGQDSAAPRQGPPFQLPDQGVGEQAKHAYTASATRITSLRRNWVAWLMMNPMPALALTCSATTRASQATPRLCRSPVSACGSAPGKITCLISSLRRRRSDVPTSTSRASTPRMPANVFRYSGIAVPSAIRMILGSSPIPNQTMNTGIRPNSGRVRRICSNGSTAFSPSRLSPATREAQTARYDRGVRVPAVRVARDEDKRAGIAGDRLVRARPVGPRRRGRARRGAGRPGRDLQVHRVGDLRPDQGRVRGLGPAPPGRRHAGLPVPGRLASSGCTPAPRPSRSWPPGASPPTASPRSSAWRPAPASPPTPGRTSSPT